MTSRIVSVEEGRRALGAAIEAAQRIVAFTGAGISTECGVPDFRSPDSPWRRYPPIDFAAFQASAATRVEAWRRKFAMDDLSAGARPGRTHRALTRLAGSGRLALVITQNIDGLQQASGFPAAHLVELHGNGTFARCLSCGARHELPAIRRALESSGAAPVCPCGGMIKSATVAFGQAVPRMRSPGRARRRAIATFPGARLFLVVRPAAHLPRIAVASGAALAIVNRESTPLDDIAHLVINADVGTILDA